MPRGAALRVVDAPARTDRLRRSRGLPIKVKYGTRLMLRHIALVSLDWFVGGGLFKTVILRQGESIESTSIHQQH